MPSKHANAGRLVQRGLYDNLRSFAELEQRISALGDENTKIVGDAFEVFVEGYLATHQKMQAETVWLVGQIPPDIRLKLNLPNDAKGIDGVFGTRTGILVPYQVKFRSQRAYLTYTEIAPFLGLTERATDRIVFTNSNELAEDVKNRDAMRTVRGIDFDDLTEDDFKALSCWLREQPVAVPKFSPRDPDQIKALKCIIEALRVFDRAHVVMACGTGKTLVALWAAEVLKPKTVLVLVPSLTLLQQTLDEWSRHNSWGRDFTYLCVCSDPTVVTRDANDPIHLDASDLDFRVDTSPGEVRRFIENTTPNAKVVFSTYQSSAVVSEGVRGLTPFDIAIFDEAHKTTGPQGGVFAHSLSDANISIRKRLFFTATPRHYDIRHRDKEGDFRIISMDDETIYGPRAYTLTFGSAAQQGIICNYKVVISVVDGQEINEFALKHGITLVEGDLIRARWVANQIAIERAIERTNAKHAISFHSRVSSAKEFSTDGSRGIRQFLPEFSVFHVNGEQKSSERKQLIRSFRDASEALVTNARCLTEGIDVPAVDMVAFIDPRRSKIDIAQATGRAMRKPPGSDKEVGYVVIPLFLERKSGETLEEALDRSDFSGVADVLNAMQEQDEDLVQIIREIQEAKGQGEIFDPRALSEKIEVIGHPIHLSTLRSNIFADVVTTIGISWDEWYGRLKAYKQREGHCRVPAKHKENGFRLGQWVSVQRLNTSLSQERRQRLNDLGFNWDPHVQGWEEGLQHLDEFVKAHKHCRVPTPYKSQDGYKLGGWVVRQRSNSETLSSQQKARLDALGFDWDPQRTLWDTGFHHLKIYKDRQGHCGVPKNHNENGFSLGLWVNSQRQRKDIMPAEQRGKLDEIGFIWDVLEADWNEGLNYLSMYRNREGHCRVAQRYIENGYRLGQWVSVQRLNESILTDERRRRLDELGFVWNPHETVWKEGFRHLEAFVKEHRHCLVPSGYKSLDGYQLGNWVGNQRQSEDRLSGDRKARLNAMGFDWNPYDTAWQVAFEHLQAFVKEHKHCRVFRDYVAPDGYKLGQWVHGQRQLQDKLSRERKSQLDSLGFDWDPITSQWEEGFEHLQAFVKEHKHCRVFRDCVAPDGYKLGQWVHGQRQLQDKLSTERKARVESLGFDWNPHAMDWQEGFGYLKKFKEREGHCRVPPSLKEDGFRLGSWVQRQRFHRDGLSEERQQRLEEIGFVWDPFETDWEESFRYLTMYKEREGHCLVPRSHKENGFCLGHWVNRQRHKMQLSEVQRQRLDRLGFVWDPFGAAWEEGLRRLKAFKDREGHCRVPLSHKENGYRLGTWVNNLRQKRIFLLEERRRQLDALGFVWKVQKPTLAKAVGPQELEG